MNGEITPRELKHILGAKNDDGAALMDEEWERLINEFDSNGDGMINFVEFKNMMYSLHINRMQKGQDLGRLFGIKGTNKDIEDSSMNN